MKIVIFGRKFTVMKQKSDKDSVRIEDDKLLVSTSKKCEESLVKEFLMMNLYSKLVEIYNEIKKEGKIEILGDLNFEIVEKIDNKSERVAKLKGNTIVIKLNAVALPKPALKYIVAHEIAHIFTKRHTRRFWEIVKMIYPKFKRGYDLLTKYEKLLSTLQM